MTEFDISKHVLVPKHIILSDKEKHDLLKTYNIKVTQLPRILLSDPAIKPLEAKVGDVIKIIRNSETAGKTVYYRVVVRGLLK